MELKAIEKAGPPLGSSRRVRPCRVFVYWLCKGERDNMYDNVQCFLLRLGTDPALVKTPLAPTLSRFQRHGQFIG
eukprot:4493162-Heterocapsa_arctica.AAC.1